MLRARSNANFDRRCYVSLQMEVADYGKKGRGYRAVCDVEPGTLLLSERPMIVRNSDVSKYRAIGKIIMAKLAHDSETALRFYQVISERVLCLFCFVFLKKEKSRRMLSKFRQMLRICFSSNRFSITRAFQTVR